MKDPKYNSQAACDRAESSQNVYLKAPALKHDLVLSGKPSVSIPVSSERQGAMLNKSGAVVT